MIKEKEVDTLKEKIDYRYTEEDGHAQVIIHYKNKTFYGEAICHENDIDFKSRRTGLTIAEDRAFINYMKYICDNEIKPKIAALKQLYYSMKHSRQFNPKSYEAKMLYRQIRNYEEDLNNIKAAIEDTKNRLNKFIEDKDKFYKKLREKRVQTTE